MSTLSGNAIKGEKGKKFQQLKINLCAANKPSEPEQQQHKSSIQRKQHGMTSLGKVPTARRPTNLPSEKSEHSGNDPSINLVPSGGAGWGNKQNESGSTTPSLAQNTTSPTNIVVNNISIGGTSQQVPHVQHYPPTSRMPPMSQVSHVAVHHGHTDVKTWAMRTQNADSSAPNFLAPQSPLFQHEFPSLSSSTETTTASTPATATATQKTAASAAADSQYGPGPSLRPQTEGSWIQGGSRPQGPTVPAVGNASATAPVPVRPTGPYPVPLGPDGARNNLGPSGVGVVQGGPYPPPPHVIPPQFNGMMPAFMLRGPYPPGGFPPSFQPPVKGVGPRVPYGGPYMPSGPHAPGERFGPQSGANSGKRSYDDEDVKIGPIVKEEDLHQMAEISNDIGWAGHSMMDYSKKLHFSDDEDDGQNKENHNRTRSKTQALAKGSDKSIEKKGIEKENDLRNSKECLKEREKLFVSDARPPEVKNAWHVRRPLMQTAAPPTSRYQIPAGRFEEDDEAWQEKRRLKKEEMEIIVQRAKERKEEEEKRFIDQQNAAALKLKKLEEKILAQAENGENFDSQSEANFDDETRKIQNAAPIPVVKDASEFRELTQLVDRSSFVKKDSKEREIDSQSFSRSYQANNVAPRFQNLNRQNSTGGPALNTSRSNASQQSQFSSKHNIGGFGTSRHGRLDSESISEKDRDWTQEEARKDRDGDRYSKETQAEREYGYDRDNDRKYENRFAKEFESKRRCYGEKDEYSGESYGRSFEREMKSERKNSESEREKSKNYEHHRYADEGQDKDGRWRSYDTNSEKRTYATSPRVSRTFSESENNERKRSREEAYENLKTYNAERDREYYRKDGGTREKPVSEIERENEKSRDEDGKRNKEFEAPKIQETEKINVYEERLGRGNELRESRYHRDSREEYMMQNGRSYSWADDAEIEERAKPQRREHYREERGDRYSHAQRHPPGPITRAKLEAKELESESKRNLTPLIRSDKKVELRELRKSENDDTKVKEKSEKSPVPEEKVTENATAPTKSEPHAGENQTAWKKDEKKEETSKLQSSQASNDQGREMKENARDKEEKKDTSAKSAPTLKVDELEKLSAEDKRSDRRKNNERRNKTSAAADSQWVRYSVYHGSAYSGGRGGDSKSRRLPRGPTMKITPRRDSKYSESDYSDEISESGRDDRGGSRGDRDKPRLTKSSTSTKRYDRDNRNRDYRMDDRDYMGRSRNNCDTYYYSTKQTQRGRAGFRNSVIMNKRTDGYGPPSLSGATAKNGLGGISHGSEDKRSKLPSNKDGASSSVEYSNTVDARKADSNNSSKSSSKPNPVDRSWKKNYENIQQETKSVVSSPTSTQVEANEESFATASEGTDSEETLAQMQKSKSNYPSTKRSAVVVAKPQRKSYRSTSRKRYEGRRTGPTQLRKDSGSYAGSKSTSTSALKTSTVGKENERTITDAHVDRISKDDGKSMSDKLQREYTDSQSRKNVKPRNRSNPRRSSTVSVSNGRSGSGKPAQDSSSRMQSGKSKTVDSKFGLVDGKETKSNSDISVSHMREVGGPIPAPPPAGNAWDKPLTGALRNGAIGTQKSNVVSASTASMSTTNTTTTVIVQEKSIVQITEQHSESTPLSSEMSASSTLSAEKVTTKVLENLDGATPPVQTIIFENTNFKSGPNDYGGKSKYATQLKSHRFDKDSKLDSMDASVAFGNDSNVELTSNKHDSLQMALFNKNEDLDFFDSEFTKLTEDKTAKAMELTHAMHIVQASTDADLNFKIASVKKVWDERLTEHFDDKYDTSGLVNTSASFSPSFSSHSSDPSNGSCYGNSHVDSSGHVQVDDVSLGHSEVVFNPQIQAVNSAYGSVSNCQAVVMKNDSTASSNVCKVKPQPQGVTMANVAQSSAISTTMVSQPPPLSSPSFNAFSCSTPQPNLNNNAIAATALAQMNFQQFSNLPNMPPPVPSSPVLFNSSQTPAPAPPGVYQTFQIDNSQVASRTPYGQFASYGLSAGAGIGQTSAFNHQQSLFVTPPTNAPPPEMYPSQMPQFRIQPQTFGNSSQITNHNTVLISSSSNSLMSATIKPSNQQMSAIGTKAGYQTTQNSPQVYLSLDPNAPLLGQNFLPGGQLIQRPTSNVVQAPSLPASSSYYSSASGAGQTGFFPPGTNSALPQPGTPAMGLTAAAFNTQSATQSLTQASLQNYNAQQLTQQYRTATQPSYLPKSGNTNNIMSDFVSNKTIAIPSQHDVMNPCFQPVGSQMSSSKQRLQSGGKNVPTVQQAMAQHSMQQSTYGYQPSNQMRNNSGGGGGGANKGSQYPHPIQRPVSQGNSSNRGGGNNANNNTSSSHRMSSARNNSHLVNNIQQPPSSVYYSASSGYTTSAPKMEAPQLDTKTDSTADSKLADSIKTINAKNNASATEKTVSSNE